MEGKKVKLYGTPCVGLYKEDYGSIATKSVMDPDSKMNCFTLSRKDNCWVVPGDEYNNELKNWQVHICKRQLRAHALKNMRIIYIICSKFLGSIKFNQITREVNPEIPIKLYRYQFREHMIKSGIWDVLSFPDHCN